MVLNHYFQLRAVGKVTPAGVKSLQEDLSLDQGNPFLTWTTQQVNAVMNKWNAMEEVSFSISLR